jgi:hypothetical protein
MRCGIQTAKTGVARTGLCQELRFVGGAQATVFQDVTWVMGGLRIHSVRNKA